MSNVYYPMQGMQQYPMMMPAQQPAFMPAPMGNQFAVYQQPSSSFQQNALRQPNPIGEEGFKLLRSKGGGGKVDFVVSREEMYKSICNHRHNYEWCVVPTGNPEEYKCTICGAIIHKQDLYDPEILKDCVRYLKESWEWAKIRNTGTMSSDVIVDYGKTFALLEKYPNAYRIISENYVNNDVNGSIAMQQSMPNLQNQALSMLNSAGVPYVPTYQTQYQSQIVGNPFTPMAAPYPQQPYPQPGVPPYPQQPYPAPYPQTAPYPPQQQPYMASYPQQQQPQYPPPAAAGTVVPPMAPLPQQPAPQAQPQQPSVTPPQNPVAPPPPAPQTQQTTKVFKP